MQLVLTRRYYKEGTNGTLYCEGEELCQTIERTWENNERNRSCIPEGLYELKKRYSFHHKEHLIVTGVPNRNLILIHPANNALHELQGCIAPVTKTTGEGTGTQSILATNLLYREVNTRIDKEQVWLRITSPTGEPAVPVLQRLTGPGLQIAA